MCLSRALDLIQMFLIDNLSYPGEYRRRINPVKDSHISKFRSSTILALNREPIQQFKNLIDRFFGSISSHFRPLFQDL